MARVQRTASLYETFRQMLEFQARKNNPDLTDREVTIQAARRMYLSNEATQRLLDQMENASSHTPPRTDAETWFGQRA
jgi:hypothetical protein